MKLAIFADLDKAHLLDKGHYYVNYSFVVMPLFNIKIFA